MQGICHREVLDFLSVPVDARKRDPKARGRDVPDFHQRVGATDRDDGRVVDHSVGQRQREQVLRRGGCVGKDEHQLRDDELGGNLESRVTPNSVGRKWLKCSSVLPRSTGRSGILEPPNNHRQQDPGLRRHHVVSAGTAARLGHARCVEVAEAWEECEVEGLSLADCRLPQYSG